MDPTNDPKLRSFIPVEPHSHFPIQNLPFGVFRPTAGGPPRVGVAIGELVLDLEKLETEHCFEGAMLASFPGVFGRPSLNSFMALELALWRETRGKVSRLLSGADPQLRDNARLREQALYRQSDVEMLLPVEILDYTDFYSSREHAANVGSMFRGPASALMPNWLHLPVAYHGRASSIVVSRTDIRRPSGQTKKEDAARPTFGPSRMLDFELEVGCFIGKGNQLGRSIPVGEAGKHVFGLVLVNDWSARDIQRWEYQPLGPFLAKNFATSISPWVVTLQALEPFRTRGPVQDPPPLPHLESSGDRTYDIQLEVWLQGEQMADAAHLSNELQVPVLGYLAAGCAPYLKRMQPENLRPAGFRNHQRGGALLVRQSAGAGLARDPADSIPEWRDAGRSAGRRPGHHDRLGSGRWLPRRLRRSNRAGVGRDLNSRRPAAGWYSFASFSVSCVFCVQLF